MPCPFNSDGGRETILFRWHPDESPPPIEAHSKAKLDVLRSYLCAYLDKLNANPYRKSFKLDLVDGFAGGGTFLDDGNTVSGTPLIMLEESERAEERLNRGRTTPLHFDCKYYFVDKEPAHVGHLRKVLDERGYQVDGETIVVINNWFEEAVSADRIPNVRDGPLRRQNRVVTWIDGHIPSRVIEFFLTVLSNPSRCWS